ncbi:mannitol dehydrogenase family protein [Blastococcus haudaquaticus]|uniref:Mannitol-1-phosphate 5-dehydrogenase n=1 Tax=Blastococcus haudaquaticus TaxID=1938745 RepID=A0A286H1H7_9ACTN|nr:mannitol dehydrogenase family protein [Blastococcus haudaquaticus]SOE01640.1 mannitol 2-dehydrogenase [Blastococcus haudaquaticus]
MSIPPPLLARPPLSRLTSRNLPSLTQAVATPAYDRRRVRTGVVHLGVGGFHRAHQAMYADRLMNAGLAMDWGICGVGVLPDERRMRDALAAQDGLYTLVVKHPDGTLEPRVIGSIIEYLLAPDDPEAVVEKMAHPDTRIVSLTITERGYNTDPVTGSFDDGAPDIRADLRPDAVPRTTFGLVTEALARRRDRGLSPFTVLSCDNLQGNGDVARHAFAAFASLRDPDLGTWVEREVPFPNSMVDRITPQTTPDDIAMLRDLFGVADTWPVVCEPFAQWVIEDHFPAGRPPWEEVGVQLVDDVSPYEAMKLRLLNGSHQAMAYFAALAGYQHVHDACRDPLVNGFLQGYMDHEVSPTLPAVPGVDLEHYKEALLERFGSAAVADQVSRLCAQTSALIPKYVLPVLRAGLASGGEVHRAAAIVASWARFAEGWDDHGRPLPLVDRHADRLRANAGRLDMDPLAFIADQSFFGDLVDDERFVEPYRRALTSLREHGARATLAALTHVLRGADAAVA